MQHGLPRNIPCLRRMARALSIRPLHRTPRTGRIDRRHRSMARQPQNTQKETREDDLESQREKNDSRNHDSQSPFRIERAKVMASPVLESQAPRSGSGQYEQNAHHKADFESQVTKHFSEARIFGQQSF